jgi:precorrin isomerase
MQNISINPQLTMKKTKSTPSISDIEKKIIQNILEKRQKILKGIKMIEKFLSQSSTKTNVHVCCFIAKKVKHLAIETDETIKRSLKER